MTKKIFKSILIVSGAVLLASIGVILGVTYGYFTDLQREQLSEQLVIAAAAVESGGVSYLESISSETYRITWIEEDGDVIYDTLLGTDIDENHADREEVQEALETGSGESIRYSSTILERTIYSAVLLSDGSVLRISVEQATVGAMLLGMIQPILVVAVIALILSGIFAYLISRRIVKPLNSLDVYHPLENDTYEEISPLLHRINAQQQEVKAAEQSRVEFTANVTHELKTPLQGIIGSAELMEQNMVSDEDKPRFLGYIKNEAKRMVTMIDDIINLSKLDEKQEIEKSEVDLFSIMLEAAENLATVAGSKNITINTSGEPVAMIGSYQLLYEIVYNLCDNAIKYNNEGGRVDMSVSKSEDTAVLVVKDNGIGIPAEHQGHIFERFYRVDKSHSREGGGTGLGLSIVKHATEAQHGRINLKSEPGVGTEITVEFKL